MLVKIVVENEINSFLKRIWIVFLFLVKKKDNQKAMVWFLSF